jgi:photosystem II stability/assembly factor-like uncharacterized protein
MWVDSTFFSSLQQRTSLRAFVRLSIDSFLYRPTIRAVRFLLFSVCLLLAACQNNPLSNNPQIWISLNDRLPTHVTVTALAVNPHAPDEMFAGTYDAVGMYSTRNVDDGWLPDNTGLPAAPVFALRARDRELFAGTAAGLYRRAWNANYWQRADPIPQVAVYALATDANDTLYAATDGRGIWTSDDDGATWTRLPGLDDESLLSILPLDAQTIFVGTAGHGVFVTRNRGIRWDNPAQFQNAYVPLLARDPRDAKTVFVGPRGGLYRSTDAGMTWHALGGGIEKQIVDALLIYTTPDGKTVLLAGTAGDGLWLSGNEGMAWQLAQTKDGARAFPPGRAVLTILHQDKKFFAGTVDGVFRADESPDNWIMLRAPTRNLGTPALHALARQADALWAATDDGLYRQTRANFFERVASANINAPVTSVAFTPASPTRVYAGTDGKGVFVSDDAGATWNAAGGELGGKTRVAQILVDPTNPEIVYARLLFERLYKSTNGGDTWRTIWPGMPIEEQLQTFAIAPSNPQILYAGGDTQLFFSDNGGETWHARGLSGISTLALWIDPNDAAQVWAGATDGLYLSNDAGKTWRGPLLQGITVAALARDARGNFYVGTKYNGLFRTDASAEQFTRVGQGLANASVDALGLDETRGVLYATTNAGLFCAWLDAAAHNAPPSGEDC